MDTDDSDDPGYNGHRRDFEDPFDAAQRTNVEDEGRGLNCEIQTYESRLNSRGERLVLQSGKRNRLPQPREVRAQDFHSALVVVKTYDKNVRLEKTELHIQSPHVKKALRHVVKEYPGMNLDASKITIEGLPKCFFHYRKELAEYGATLDDPVAAQHLVFTLQYMYRVLQDQSWNYINWMESPNVVPGLLCENLWMAFRPGDLIYSEVDHEHRVYRFSSMYRSKLLLTDEPGDWVITALMISYDGKDFGHKVRFLRVRGYDHYKPLTKLAVFPLRFHSDTAAIYKDVVARGKRYIGLRGVHHIEYSGKAEMLSHTRRDTLEGEEDEYPIRTQMVSG